MLVTVFSRYREYKLQLSFGHLYLQFYYSLDYIIIIIIITIIITILFAHNIQTI